MDDDTLGGRPRWSASPRGRRPPPPAAVAALVLVTWACGADRDGRDRPAEAPVRRDAGAAESRATSPVAPETARTRHLPFQVFATPRQAIEQVLATNPRIIGFGEFHELTTSKKVASTLRRFTAEILAALTPRASDLIVEIWARDSCGDKGVKVSQQVQQATERPASTQNEVITLLKSAKASGVQNHVLQLTCADYDGILTATREVDYEKLLLLVARKLGDKAAEVLDHRSAQPAEGRGRDLIVLYGGATHNDLYPYETTREFAYAPQLARLAGDRYVEVDLYVPEYVEGDELLSKEDWYPIFQEHGSRDSVVLIQRGTGSYILVMRRDHAP